MEGLNCEELNFINSPLDEKLFDADLDLDPDDYLPINRDVSWFTDGYMNRLSSQSDPYSKMPDEEEKLALIDEMLTKSFGVHGNLLEEQIDMVAIGADHDKDLHQEMLLSPPSTESISSDSSDADSLEQLQKLIQSSDPMKQEPLDMDDDEEEDDAVPIAVATIILDSNSNSSIKNELDEEYITTEQEIEIHHNYSCGNKYMSPPSSADSSPNPRKSSNRGARSKPITDLILTDEEKRLLSKEGFQNFPCGGPSLTKHDEKILRKIRRKIRNKRSAQCSRQRKKEYLEDLEKKFDRCSHENHGLKKEVLKLRKENDSLMLKVKKLLFMNSNGGSNHNSSGQASLKTSFFVVILSFLLVLLPFFRHDGIDDNMSFGGDRKVIGTGRNLLMALSNNDTDFGYYFSSLNSNDSMDTLFNPSTNYISY